MSLPNLYPPAIAKLDGTGVGSWSGRGEWKLCLHTTESRSLPSYDGGRLAPHLTYWPARRTFTQHVPFSRPSESVRVHDDDQLIQLEIVAYSDENLARQVGGLPVSALTDAHMSDLAGFVNWLRRYLPIQLARPARLAASYAEANAAGFRFGTVEFYRWPGLIGHQHVPGNTHWDPGRFDWDRLIRVAGGPSTIVSDVSARIWTRETWQTLVSAGIVEPNSPATVDYWSNPTRTDAELIHAENDVMQKLARRSSATSAAGHRHKFEGFTSS